METFLTEQELVARQKWFVKTIRNQRVAGTGVPFARIGLDLLCSTGDLGGRYA